MDDELINAAICISDELDLDELQYAAHSFELMRRSPFCIGPRGLETWRTMHAPSTHLWHNGGL